MKKISKLLASFLIAVLLIGCGNKAEDNSSSAKILCPTGAPSLALVSSYEEIVKDGSIDFVNGSDQLQAELAKTDSEYDIIVAPINLGAKLIETGQTDYRIGAVITWGNLYYVGTSDDALNKEGELALFGQGAVPGKIVDVTNIETTLEPVYYADAQSVQARLLSSKAEVGLLAEPLATATIAKAKSEGIELKVIKDLQAEYGEEGYPQAAVFVKEGSSYESLFKEMDDFTNNGYEGLKDYLESIGIETLGLPNVEITVKSIDRQNVHFKHAKDVQVEIEEFLKLFNITYSENMIVK